jgi:ornithine cyclodeaminase
VKVVSVFDHNAARGLPLIHGVVLLVDPETGAPTALLDAEVLTALRTGAASGLATDLLARPDASCLAVFGAGAQARTQVEGVRAVRPIRRVLLWGRDAVRTARFAAELAAAGLAVETSPAAERLGEAQVICTATTARAPVFRAEDVPPGAHVNGTGSYRPDDRELPGALIAAARVVVDHREAALAEAGDVVLPIRDGILDASRVAELGEIVAGSRPGRASPDEITVFKSVGNAVQDVVAAQAVVEAAIRRGIGAEVRIG